MNEDEIHPVEGDTQDDDQFVEHLRGLASQADPVPGKFLKAARGSYTWRTAELELAELSYDSVFDEGRAAVVRDGGDTRLLTFEAPELMIEVEVTVSGNDRSIAGQLVPASEAVVAINHAGGTDVAHADSLGRFAAGPVTPGPVRLSCCLAGATGAVITEWVPI